MNKKVCIIGAGAGGLCSARHFKETNFLPVILECTSKIGGTWVYNENTGMDPITKLPIQTSMYKNLRTNLPKEVMAFPDFPFPSHLNSFMKHEEVRTYLEDYCNHFKLGQYIKFNTKVTHVEPGPQNKWIVNYENTLQNTKMQEVFEAIAVCNGHYSVPSYGNIDNIDHFNGLVTHSHYYRTPDKFKNLNVIILGGAASGMDITLEVSREANKVFLSHNNNPLTCTLPPNVEQIKGLTGYDHNTKSFQLSNGETLNENIDAIMFCTGYKYFFPFLADGVIDIDNEKRRVKPLYKHLININYPTMAFIGIPLQICPFPLFDYQARYFAKAMTEEIVLPTKHDMLKDTNEEFKSRLSENIPEKHFHRFGTYQWRYIEELEKGGKLPPLNPNVSELYNHIRSYRKQNLLTYKNLNYELRDDGNFALL